MQGGECTPTILGGNFNGMFYWLEHMAMQANGKKWFQNYSRWSSRENDEQKIANVIADNGGDQRVAKFLVALLKIEHHGHADIQHKIIGVGSNENICERGVDKLLRPNAGLDAEHPLVDLDEPMLYIGWIGEVDCIMKVGVNSDAKAKRQPVANKAPVLFHFEQDNENNENHHGYPDALQVP